MDQTYELLNAILIVHIKSDTGGELPPVSGLYKCKILRHGRTGLPSTDGQRGLGWKFEPRTRQRVDRLTTPRSHRSRVGERLRTCRTFPQCYHRRQEPRGPTSLTQFENIRGNTATLDTGLHHPSITRDGKTPAPHATTDWWPSSLLPRGNIHISSANSDLRQVLGNEDDYERMHARKFARQQQSRWKAIICGELHCIVLHSAP
ncbi:hypothetical protein B0H13DRAFT_2266828 [Mycena leptocephala]|nr:hypothetical protein B0H13DRAFT_2266828 [Mycena leptocephala]